MEAAEFTVKLWKVACTGLAAHPRRLGSGKVNATCQPDTNALSTLATPMKPRHFLTLLIAASALAAGGCATTPPARTAAPVPPNATPPADTPYPAWTKAAGWLLLPFSGANGSVNF